MALEGDGCVDMTNAIQEQNQDQSERKPDIITYSTIENMKKVISSHGAALDFDKGFLHRLVTKDDFKLLEVDEPSKEAENNKGQKRKKQSKILISKNKQNNGDHFQFAKLTPYN